MASTVTLEEARAPDGVRIYAIGDIHGRLDLLSRLYGAIVDEIERDRPVDHRIIFLGDYVDRGLHSAGVISFLIDRVAEDPRHVALAGNHDVAFVDFLAAPNAASLFARFGGDATAAAYGVPFDVRNASALAETHAALVAGVPEAHRAFLENLAFSATLGDFFFCHAGVRPGVALARQTPHDLAWIRHDFLRHQEPFAKVIVHGHTPVERVEMHPNRINADTGAYFSDRLSAVVLEADAKRVVVTAAPGE